MSKVLLYTTKDCSQCPAVKKYLDRYSIEYRVIELDDAPELRQKLIDQTGMMTVPIVQYGKRFCVGFKPVELKKLLGL
jgi:glutaredoxin